MVSVSALKKGNYFLKLLHLCIEKYAFCLSGCVRVNVCVHKRSYVAASMLPKGQQLTANINDLHIIRPRQSENGTVVVEGVGSLSTEQPIHPYCIICLKAVGYHDNLLRIPTLCEETNDPG